MARVAEACLVLIYTLGLLAFGVTVCHQLEADMNLNVRVVSGCNSLYVTGHLDQQPVFASTVQHLLAERGAGPMRAILWRLAGPAGARARLGWPKT